MEKFSQILDGINIEIFAVDKDLNIKYSNLQSVLLAGTHLSDLKNKKCYSAFLGLPKPCKNCPVPNWESEKKHDMTHDVITYSGERKIFKSYITQIAEGIYAETLTDITLISKDYKESIHNLKQIKASNVLLLNEKAKLERHNNFFETAFDNMAQGIMVVSSDYSIIIINENLLALGGIAKADRKNIKCYSVYGFDKPCKDCPFDNGSVKKSLRKMGSKHMTVTYSPFDRFMVENLRDTTREIKLIDEIKESQEEIQEKQRQMSILNKDLLRMNEKLKHAKAVIDDELRQVGHIQGSLLPETLPEVNGYDFGAAYLPAEHAGGDYYDCIKMSNNYWGFLVADVSGHGTPAAVIMAITRAIMRSYTFDVVSSSEALGMVNDILCDNIHTKDFVTMFYAVFDMAHNRMNLASAGHNPVLLFDKSEFLVKKITAKGMFLGTFENLEFEEKKLSIDFGDIFFMYTDGLVEAMNPKREQYGYDRLMSKLMMFNNYPCKRIIDEIMEDVKSFTEGTPFEDDITIFAIKRNEAQGNEKI